jgi:hypothetical protein
MEKSTLKTLRLISPGILILLFGLLLLSDDWSNFFSFVNDFEFDTAKLTFKTAIIVLAGVLYYALDLRKIVWRKYFLADVHDNIFTTLMQVGQYTPAEQLTIRNPNNLTLLFYSFIDNDASLSNKSKDVYANGYVASLFSDLIVISTAFVFIFTITAIWTQKWYYWSTAMVAIVVCLVSCLCLVRVRKRHIELSNDQMHFIMQQYKNELINRINGIL